MAKVFTRNMFVMLLAIMIGTIIIIYFVGDIVHRSNIDTLNAEHRVEISNLKGKNENFTSYFLKSSGVLDQAREDRAFGNYHFDLGFLWYQTALSEKDSELIEEYKIRGIVNCTDAMPFYKYSYQNFLQAKDFFEETKSYTTYDKYISLLDLYVNLTDTGSKLTMLRYNASNYLIQLTENMTFNFDTGNVTFLENMSGLFMLFNETMFAYGGFIEEYEEYQEIIDEYEFFDEQR
jgi:hypothetical protein